MKLDHLLVEEKDIQRSEDFDSLAYQMDSTQSGLLFKILSQYSNPIGSIVRELTTNAFDAHIEAGTTDKPVIVRLMDGNELTGTDKTFEVEDYGTGLSPERVSNIYTRFLASTKREGNSEHGAYGLGSKSPLSYCEMFYVTTFYEGTKYDFWIHKAKGVPTLEKVNSEPTDRSNGTIVQIPIQESTHISKFRTEIQRQLKYFDNVYYENCGVDNDFTIYRGEHFLYNPDSDDTEIHICLGKVYYPIDLSAMGEVSGYGKPKWAELPIALKFEIGELPVVWNRENIEYTDNAVETIKEKIEAVKEELAELYNDKFSNVNSIDKYIEMVETSRSNSLELVEGVELNRIDKVVDTSPKYPKYSNTISIPTRMDALFDMFKLHKQVNKGLIDQSHIHACVGDFFSSKNSKEPSDLYFANSPYATMTNKYIYEELLDDGEEKFYIVRERTQDLSEYMPGYSSSKYIKDSSNYDAKATALAKQFWNEVYDYALSKMKDYDSVDVPESFKEKVKARRATPSAKAEPETLREQDIHVKHIDDSDAYHSRLEFRQDYIKARNLIDYQGLIIYGHREQSEDLLLVGYMLEHYKKLKGDSWGTTSILNLERAMVFKISMSNVNLIEHKPNAIFVEDFLKHPNNRIMHRIKAWRAIREKSGTLASHDFLHRVSHAFPEYEDRVQLIKKYSRNMQKPSSSLGYSKRDEFKALLDKVDLDPRLGEVFSDFVALQNRYPLVFSIEKSDIQEYEEDVALYINSKGRYNISLMRRLEKFKIKKEEQ